MGVFAALIGLAPELITFGISIVHGIEALFGKKTGQKKQQVVEGLLGDVTNELTTLKGVPLPAGASDTLAKISTVTTSVMNAIHGHTWPTSLSQVNVTAVTSIVQGFMPLIDELPQGANVDAIVQELIKAAPAIDAAISVAKGASATA